MGYDSTPLYGLRTPQRPNKPTVTADLKQLAEDTDKAIGQSVTALSGLQGNITSMQGEITTLRASVRAVAEASDSGDWKKAVSSEASTRESEDNKIRSDASALTSRVSAVEGKVKYLEQPPFIPQGSDLDTYRTTGDWRINNGATMRSLLNTPTGVKLSVGFLSVRVSSSQYGVQALYVGGKSPQVFIRGMASIEGGPNYPWGDWVEITNQAPASSGGSGYTPDNSVSKTTDSVQNAGIRNKVLVDELTRKYRVSTGGKGAVAFRFDHGLNNFQSKVLPLLREFDFPSAQILNSRNWGYAENSEVTASVVDSWVQNDKVEIWNHSATHKNAATESAIITEVKTGLEELRSQIPSADIMGWAVPGVGSSAGGATPYMGMGTGTSFEQFSASFAGQLILANHAVSAGNTANTFHRPLDGIVRNGEGHLGLDTRSSARPITAEIDKAIANKTGLQLFLHPSLIDNGKGGISSETLREIFQYIKQKQDAGVLAVLSPYQLVCATL